MTDDIVTRLRGECQCSDNCRAVGDPCISMRAADEIVRLRAICEQFAKSAKFYGTQYGSDVYQFVVNEKKFTKALKMYAEARRG